MSKENNGGPAFPYALPGHPIVKGMTLRDYFAAKAIPLIRQDLSAEFMAARCYEIADAMLKARQ